MPKYNGRFVVKDIANGRQYLADLLYQFELGDSLAGWTLGGTTFPTIAADGQIDLFENTNLADQPCYAYITIPNTIGRVISILHVKITKQSDDTSLDEISFQIQIYPVAGLAGPCGMNYRVDSSVPRSKLYWNNLIAQGTNVNITFVPLSSTEYDINLVMTDKDIVVIINNTRLASIPINCIGNAPLSVQPAIVWNSSNKQVMLYVRHDAGQISHYRVRDIKVGRLVGTGEA